MLLYTRVRRIDHTSRELLQPVPALPLQQRKANMKKFARNAQLSTEHKKTRYSEQPTVQTLSKQTLSMHRG